MTVGQARPQFDSGPYLAWRQRTSPSAVPFPAAAEEPGQIAFVFSLGDSPTAAASSALNALHVTTVVRSFDADALRIVGAAGPDIVVLACDPAEDDHLQAISLLAQENSWHLLVLDTNEAAAGAAAALDAGADTVLSAFAAAPLVRATIAAMLRRLRQAVHPVPWPKELKPVVGTLTVDSDTFEVRDAGELLHLTPTEFKIVAHLALHVGLVRSPSQIMAALHDYSVGELEARQTVRVYIRRIRTKLAASEVASVEVVSYRGRGYRIEPTGILEPTRQDPSEHGGGPELRPRLVG